MVLDCNGHPVPMGLVAIQRLAQPEPDSNGAVFDVLIYEGPAVEWYIDRRQVAKAEYDRAIDDFRRRGR